MNPFRRLWRYITAPYSPIVLPDWDPSNLPLPDLLALPARDAAGLLRQQRLMYSLGIRGIGGGKLFPLQSPSAIEQDDLKASEDTAKMVYDQLTRKLRPPTLDAYKSQIQTAEQHVYTLQEENRALKEANGLLSEHCDLQRARIGEMETELASRSLLD